MSNIGTQVRVAIVCAHPLLVAGLANLCQEDARFDFRWELPSLGRIDEVLEADRPDVILVDWEVVTQTEAAAEVVLLSQTASLLFFMHEWEVREAWFAFKTGGRGVLRKSATPATIREAMLTVARGGIWGEAQDPWEGEGVVGPVRTRLKAGQGAMDGLTRRERQIVELICRGFRNRQIAMELQITETTVCHHLTSIFGKLEVEDRVGLLIFAHKHALVDAQGALAGRAIARRS